MKNFVKYGLVGLAGYLVGFYEMKYKTLKLMLESEFKKNSVDKEDEAQ